MLDELDALSALEAHGTMGKAANRLRITQSAISKRISLLAERVGVPLIERDGRRVRLTAHGAALLDRARPLAAELREAVFAPSAESGGRLVVGVSESVLASWGPSVFARVRAQVPTVEVTWAAHRSLVAIERVRAGECHVAVCAGVKKPAGDLSQLHLADEPYVLLANRKTPSLRRNAARPLQVITIEEGSASWQSMRRSLGKLRRAGYAIEVVSRVQSFAAVVQLSLAGFGVGLAPRGIARALGAKHICKLPTRGVHRPIVLVGRPRTMARSGVAQWTASLAAEMSKRFA